TCYIQTYLIYLYFYYAHHLPDLHSFPTRRSSDLRLPDEVRPHVRPDRVATGQDPMDIRPIGIHPFERRNVEGEVLREAVDDEARSEEHTSELQSPCNLVCRLLLEKKKKLT